MKLDLHTLALVMGGKLSRGNPGMTVSGVSTDSRSIKPGSVFFALKGEKFDGHKFVRAAAKKGAKAAVVQKGFREKVRGMGLIELRDPLFGLGELARFERAGLSARVVGITGSVGKTTTTQLIAAVLSQRHSTRSSPENYNNEIGLPLSVLQLEAGVEWLVQEMAMYSPGEIKRLTEIAHPEVGVVTNVGPTHLERLGTIERIASAKAELLLSLPPYGLAVLNGDDARVRAMAPLTAAGRTVFYGMHAGNDLWADELQVLGLEGLSLRLHWRDESVMARLPLLGRHNAYAALAATAVGLFAGLSWPDITAGLADRQAQVRLQALPGLRGSIILDDSYNASPASTAAALDLLAEMRGRKVAVLGGMLELGSFSEEGHRLVGKRAAEVASLLVAVGKLGRWIAAAALANGMPQSAVIAVADNDEAVRVLAAEGVLEEGDFVLIKGSRGVALDQVVSRLAVEGVRPADAGRGQPGSAPQAVRADARVP